VTWEERWHPLREEWVIVAAHRQNRPWSGETVAGLETTIPAHDPSCYLCPGNTRVSGKVNPRFGSVFVFDNDHPCVAEDAPSVASGASLYGARAATGIARVVCFSPQHNTTLAELSVDGVETVLSELQDQYRDLGDRADVSHVLMFENKGEAVGVSNPHPHGQIYATNFVFKTIETEAAAGKRYWEENKRTLFGAVLAEEASDGRRILYENDSAIAFVPYFARYAYEVYVAPKDTHGSVADLSRSERRDLADALKHVLVKFDNLWQMPFPYVMPFHQAPTDGEDHSSFHFHIEFHPPLRKPNLLKYLAGPEIGGGNFLSDTAPEEKAAELRALSDRHYKLTEETTGNTDNADKT
jgi:UDPglucose--hexose-1-phosphate uridylyltransferase